MRTENGLPDFISIVEKVKFYIRGANIRLVNALTNDEIKLDAAYNLFVGGNKLGRGVTIKNLLVSYYGRNPKRPNSDTVLHMRACTDIGREISELPVCSCRNGWQIISD